VSKLRWFILAFGPIPLVAVSIALCDWLRSEPSGPPSANHVLSGNFLVVRPLVGRAMAGETPQPRSPVAAIDERLAGACRQVAEKLQSRLGAECHSIVRPPFVIAGDLGPEELDDWHQETVGPAARAMAARYFDHAPTEPITILLFSEKSSYDSYAEKLFGDRDVSIYGYYKPQLRTLVMNIATGGGTLVHELTHALADFDFPRLPDWFNEGLASLHEQCRFREDAAGPWIEGLENWRLPGLQKAIRSKRVRALESLVTEDDFRGTHEGLNYAQARYFCLYMQRQGVLEDFYRRFRDHQAADPHGAAAVRAVFPKLTWDELDGKYRDWVLTLKRP
jgi:hypothetical protein